VEHLPGLGPQRGIILLALLFDDSAAKAGEPIQIVERFMNEGRPEEAVLYIRRSDVPGRKD
jgi:hypothetical protein